MRLSALEAAALLACACLALATGAAAAAAADADGGGGSGVQAQVLPQPVIQPQQGQPWPPDYQHLPRPSEGPIILKERAAAAHAAVDSWVERFLSEQGARPTRRPEDLAPRNNVSLLERLIGRQDLPDSCGVDERQLPVKREYLVVLPAGPDFDASKWMGQPDLANWDLVVIYYGSDPASFSCPLCKAVYIGNGPKWRLAYRFTLLPEWNATYSRDYKAIMFPDDDLVMDTCTVNRMFSVVQAYDLLLAQPSLCPAAWSHTPYKALYQHPENILRFTTFIEIMAPVFSMPFFQGFIRPTLFNAHYGWGLDFVWPFLLRYPPDKIAVVDEVCMYHPPSNPQKGNSIYMAEAPYRQKEEEQRRFGEWGYFDSEIARRGFWFQAVEVLGAVPKPAPPDSLLATSNKILSMRLGALYPVLLLFQTLIILCGCLAVVCLRASKGGLGRGAWQSPAVTDVIV